MMVYIQIDNHDSWTDLVNFWRNDLLTARRENKSCYQQFFSPVIKLLPPNETCRAEQKYL